jgi:uncharacterized protein (TIGR03435 family)
MPRYLIGLLTSVALFGQAPAARPEFEVASIRPGAPPGTSRVLGGMQIDGSQVTWTFLSLKDYIGRAYRVRNYQISGPDWLASQRFDITAKLPVGGSAKDVSAMLEALLEDRFQMKTHRESKDFPVYGLVVGKGGLKMKESLPDSPDTKTDSGAASVAAVSRPGGVTVNYSNGSNFTFADNRFEGRKLSTTLMADVMARFTDRPVVDMTDLKGNYDFVLELTPEDFRAMGIRAAIAAGAEIPPQVLQQIESASGDSLSNALEKLGLKLESRKAPIEVLVIDHAEKTPTDN